LNNKIIIAIVVIAALVLVYKFFLSGPKSTGADIEPAEFSDLAKDKDAVIIDVRSGFEFGGDKISWREKCQLYIRRIQRVMLKSLIRDKTYLVYCASGSRSAGAVNTMKQMGFEKVYNLKGGMEHWKSAGMPVVR